MSNFIETYAIKVTQPLGEFFLTSFPADKLKAVSFPEELTYMDENGNLKGDQRKLDQDRLKGIAKYIDSVEMAFPNSIILSANYTQDGSVIEDDENADNETVDNDLWRVEEIDNNLYKMIVPTSKKLASIIDGQHRVLAFDYVKPERKLIDIPCAIFFDLPNSYQAFLFATINGNQKPVNRSLALEQFGFNVGDEPQKSWTPEKLAVYLSRKLNMKPDSPFDHRIKIAPRDPKGFFVNKADWYVSMSTVVDGILGLISNKPKRDRVDMAQERIFFGRSRDMVKDSKDSSPLREWYIYEKDEDIYQTVKDFFIVVNELLWQNATPKSYIVKTVGVLALFDLLKQILQKNKSEANFKRYIIPVQNVDFSADFFQASGVGRSRIRATLLIANGFEVRSGEETNTNSELV